MSEEVQAAQDKAADFIFGEIPKEPEAKVEAEPVVEPVEESVEEPEETEGDEYQPDPKPVVEGDEPEAVEFEWDGQLIEAPQNIKDALMRTKDYTEKTQEVATARKELEIQSVNLKRVNAQYEFAMQVQDDVMKAHQLDQQVEQARAYMRENIDTLSHMDMEKIRLAMDDTRLERDKIINGVNSKNKEFQQAHEQTVKELVDKSTEVLRQKVPGWDDSHETQIKDYALSLGIPEQAYNSVIEPIEKFILYKAMQYDALKSGVTSAVKTLKGVPTIKPKSRSPMPQETQDRLNLRKKIKSSKRSAKDKSVLIGEDIASRLKL